MMRDIISIDEEKCTGCGLCVPNCPEGAIQIIDGKARLVNDRFCDGLGACIGHCPEGAISIERREAEPYDERRVMDTIIQAGPATIRAHLEHLRDHGETARFGEAVAVLREKGLPIPDGLEDPPAALNPIEPFSGCPGSRALAFQIPQAQEALEGIPSALRQWPVQLHLVSPMAPYFKKADALLAADCSAYAVGDFHRRFMTGKALAIACPKLDEGQPIYLAKLEALIREAEINTLTVVLMEVPCCSGLLRIALEARNRAKRHIPIKRVVIGIRGNEIDASWL